MSRLIKDKYEEYKASCNEMFYKLKAKEEELNRIFIEIYGLEDELTPDVAEKDVTIHFVADTKEDAPEGLQKSNYLLTKKDVIKQFISYSVGCMFGRYSLDKEGLIIAGEIPRDSLTKHRGLYYLTEVGMKCQNEYELTNEHFGIDPDNVIPICDEEYFDDDIVFRFCEFVRVAYGKETLEENLKFIADALGNKGNTSREVIRNYFLNDFYADHIKTYQKRPIYWLFDSGKENGFKALVYMHRWNADTIGNLRVEYLHRTQQMLENEITRMQETIENSQNSRDIAAAEKRKAKLTRQLKETKDYDAKIAHLALSRTDIDLDDGVKVNYEKVQTADGEKFEILAKLK